MSRYSNEDSVKKIPNRFELVLVASQRVRELRHGHRPYVESSEGLALTALKEIAEGHVGVERLKRIEERTQPQRGPKKS